MATIKVEIEIDASVEKVWNVVSDIDNEPKFWKGTKEVRNLSKEEIMIKREITIAFRDQKCYARSENISKRKDRGQIYKRHHQAERK